MVQLSDDAGRVTRDYHYDAFGVEDSKEEDDRNPFRYTSEYYDVETDTIYLRNRYYSPSTGRFLTEDPINDGLNWYTYCMNNPVKYMDPSGLATVGLREYSEKNGGKVSWNAQTGVASINYNGISYYVKSTAQNNKNGAIMIDDSILNSVFGWGKSSNSSNSSTGGNSKSYSNIRMPGSYGRTINSDLGGIGIPIPIPESWFDTQVLYEYAAHTWENLKKFYELLELHEQFIEAVTVDAIKETLPKIAEQYGNLDCVDAAAALATFLKTNNQKFEKVEIQFYAQWYVVSQIHNYKMISENGYHVGIAYDGAIYCNVHPYVLPETVWVNDFESLGVRTVTPARLNI